MSAAHVFSRIGQFGLGIALVGGVVNSALYNGKTVFCFCKSWHGRVYTMLTLIEIFHDLQGRLVLNSFTKLIHIRCHNRRCYYLTKTTDKLFIIFR
jgi:hypothetical protein